MLLLHYLLFIVEKGTSRHFSRSVERRCREAGAEAGVRPPGPRGRSLVPVDPDASPEEEGVLLAPVSQDVCTLRPTVTCLGKTLFQPKHRNERDYLHADSDHATVFERPSGRRPWSCPSAKTGHFSSPRSVPPFLLQNDFFQRPYPVLLFAHHRCLLGKGRLEAAFQEVQ